MVRSSTALLGLSVAALAAGAFAQEVRTGAAAFGGYDSDTPGVTRKIKAADLPAPFATPATAAQSKTAPRPAGALPQVPAGFTVTEFASGLKGPRLIHTAPNGDIFVAETAAGRVTVLRGGAKAEQTSVFAEDLKGPFGIAFYPAVNPQWVYVANMTSVVRFPYKSGDMKATGPAEVIVASLPTGGHSTRDVQFSKDGKRMFVSVGSGSNVAENMEGKPADVKKWEAQYGLGAGWGNETERAAVLSFTPDGKNRKTFANGIRNCVGLTVHATTGDVYCSVNERDNLGNDLVPDYVTRVKEGGYYGWPWYYMGSNEDPRRKGERPDLAGKAIVPDVLLQPHSAALQTVFYNGAGSAAFPAAYKGDGFATLHGSWNRAPRTGYKVVRVKMNNGVPTGEYQDFLVGMVADKDSVWARPVGVTVAKDGALLVSEDTGGLIFRVAPTGK